MIRTLALGAATVSLLASTVLSATAAQPADTNALIFTIGLVSVNGSGCPAGTSAVAVSPDDTAFTVTYSDYLAQVGLGAQPTGFYKNCQLVVKVNAPQGFTYAIAEADYRGYASLASGATGTEQANYYFQGQSQNSSASHTFNGPMSSDWQATDITGVSSLVYAPCGPRPPPAS